MVFKPGSRGGKVPPVPSRPSGGQLGNTNGRVGHARKFLTQQLRARLQEPVTVLKKLLALTDEDVQTFKGKEIAAELVDQVLAQALKGDMAAAAFIWDRIEGRPPQKVSGSFTHTWDLSKLSDDELKALHSLALKAEQTLVQQEDGSYAPRPPG